MFESSLAFPMFSFVVFSSVSSDVFVLLYSSLIETPHIIMKDFVH